MLTLEETIELILKHKSDYERNDILTMIQEKRNDLGPEVINDESAAMIVARELGVDLHRMSPSARQRIEDVTESTKNVAGLVGRVERIGTVRTFARKDGGEGMVASIVISDETGSIRVALWDEKTKYISEEHISVGSIIQVRGAYVKPGLGNTTELNLGARGTLKPLENDEIEELNIEFSDSSKAEMKIGNLQENTYDVSLKVEIQRVFRVSTFDRKDGSQGKVLAMVVADESGSTRLVFWDEKADEVEGIEPGEVIKVDHAYTRPNQDKDGIEIHVGKSTVIERGLKDKIDTVESTSVYSGSSEALGMKDIANLETGMNNVDIEGKIATIYDVKTFTRKDGGEGQVQNIVIADKTSKIRVTFWGDDNSHIAEAKEGDVIRILHGYVKEGFRGGVEFQIGKMAKITLNPKGSKLKQLDLSEVSEDASSDSGGSSSEPIGKTNIANLTVGMGDVDIEGKIATIYDVKTFTRKDGGEGKVQNIVIADKTSRVRVTFWGDDNSHIAEAKEGDVIRILHGYVKEGFRGGVEFQVGEKAKITLNPKGSKLKQLDLSEVSEDASSSDGGGSSEPIGKTNIADLSVEMQDVDVEGKVVTAYDVKTFTRKDGDEGQLRNVIIADQTSKIRVTFWGKDVETVADIQEGDVIRILHGYVKEGFRGGLEYQVGHKGEIMLNPKDSDLKQLDLSDVAFETVTTKASRVFIGEIDETTEGKNVEICGIIVDMGQNRVFYDACPTCSKKLEVVDGGYDCKSCGTVEKSEPRMLYKITIDDGSGSIRATLFGTVGEKLLGMTAEEAQELIAKSGKEDEPIRATSDKIRGRHIAMHGRVRKFGDSIEISSNGLEFADSIQEIEHLKEVIQKETN